MNIKHHARRSIAAATLVASVAVAIGATGAASAGGTVPADPAEAVAGESPPASTADPSSPTSVGGGAAGATASTTVPAPTPTTTPPAAIATTTTIAPTTTPPAAVVHQLAAIAPTAPLSPVATPANASVKLSWMAPSSNGGATIDKYRVQRYSAGAWTTIAEPLSAPYTAIGLTNGTQYSFRIAAHNASGWGPYSTVVNAVPRTVPTAPMSPVATTANGSVTLTWQKPSSNGGAAIDKYRVQRYAAGVWTTIAEPTALSYTKGGLTNGVQYSFRIAAHNAAGWGPYSTVVKAVPLTVPSAPTNLTATALNGAVALTWKPPTNSGGSPIDMYMVMRAESLAGPWTTLPVQTPTNGIYGGLTNGKTYFFRVDAHNAAGWGADSQVSAVPRTVPGAPATCNADESSIESHWMVISWKSPLDNGGAPITKYEISLWQNGVNVDTFTVPAGGNNVASAYALYGQYDVRVRAINAAGYGGSCSTPVFMY